MGEWLWENKQPQSMNDLPINRSWEQDEEESVFSSGVGGISYIWPPRSYSCSFCNREFKSAQALGGHMNVHRGDRAKLKQSLGTNNFETRPWVSSSYKGTFVSSPPRSNDFVMITEGKLPSPQDNGKKKSMAVEFDFRSGKKREGSMSLRSVDYGEFEEEMLGCRKRKAEVKPSNFLSNSNAFGDLDLELRLGDAPN